MIDEKHIMWLHKVLKPFMLWWVKADVESELGPKWEIDIKCVMTYKQKSIYQRLKNKLHFKDLLNIENSAKLESLMNLVM